MGDDAAVAANNEFVKNLFGSLTRATAAANQLPASDEYKYYSTTKDFKHGAAQSGDAVLKMVRAIASRYWTRDQLPMHSAQDVDENFDEASDVLDRILEQADMLIDRHQGLDLSGAQVEVAPANQVQQSLKDRQIERDRAIARNDKLRPQLQFEDWPLDNSSAAFKPKIFFKPNAKVPLEHSLCPPQTAVPASLRSHVASLGLDPERPTGVLHPYAAEIKSLEYPPATFEARKETIYDSLEATPITWIDTHEQLLALSEELNTVREIAIDLEAHSQRSYLGFCCLCQISTRTADYLIDTLACRSSMHLLNLPFTNPAITKVLHGSDSDVLWLQRDFGLYLVNMFDTGQAARVLELPSFGLAYLLKEFCGVDADKKYQRADWRVRPLPAEMFRYAREDTHYLLYIYDRLRSKLLKQRSTGDESLLRAVLDRSETLCLKLFEKPIVTANSHLDLYNKHRISLNPQQMRVFASCFQWRDQLARQLDESTHFVQPNHSLFSLCESMPTSVAQLVACCNPCPLLVRQHAGDIVGLVNQAIKGASSIPPSPLLPAPVAPPLVASPLEPAPPVPPVPAFATNTVVPVYPPTAIASRAKLSALQPKAGSVPVKGSINLEPPSHPAAMPAQVHTVLSEISEMSLLQVAAQSLAHSNLQEKPKPASPKLERKALFDGAAPEEAAAAAEAEEIKPDVSGWLDGERAGAVKEEPAKGMQSMVERYGEVGKGVSLKRQKRKKGGSSKKPAAAQSKRAKVGDEMTKGHPTC